MLNVTTKKIELSRRSSVCSQVMWSSSRAPSFEMDEEYNAEQIPHKPSVAFDEGSGLFLLNVGGKSFRFRSEIILVCREESLLSTLIRADHSQRLIIADSFDEKTGEYYIERNIRVAQHIIDYFVTGKLHKPHDVCPERFAEELQFWRLYNVQLAPCCAPTLNAALVRNDLSELEREFDGVCCAKLRLWVWRIMEDPSSGCLSKLFSIFSIVFIFSSIVGLIMGSMPEFQEDTTFAMGYHVYHNRLHYRTGFGKFDETEGELNLVAHNLTGYVYKATDNPAEWLVKLEYLCIIWFTLEYLLRFIVTPRKRKFITRAMNLVDLLTILPVYIELALSWLGIYASQLKEFTGAMLVMRVSTNGTRLLRVLRMARVFKLARYSTGLQIFGNTVRSSLAELSMLLVFLITGTVFFSTIMYFIEKDEPFTDFSSIPASCWWTIITITTVGFGDCNVQTTLGKVVATAASITGIIILAFPVSLIVENFAQAQHQALIETQIRQSQVASLANNYIMHRNCSRRRRPTDPNLQNKSIPLLITSEKTN